MNPPVSSYFTYTSRVLVKWVSPCSWHGLYAVVPGISDVYWSDEHKCVVIAADELYDHYYNGVTLLHSNTVVKDGILYEIQNGLVTCLLGGVACGFTDDNSLYPYHAHNARPKKQVHARLCPSLHDTLVSHIERISEICPGDGWYYDPQSTVELHTIVPGLRVAECKHCQISETHMIIELDKFIFVQGDRVNGYWIDGRLDVDDRYVYYKSHAGVVTRCLMNDKGMRVKTARHALVLVGRSQIIMFEYGLVCEVPYSASVEYINVKVTPAPAEPRVIVDWSGKRLHHTCLPDKKVPFIAMPHPYHKSNCSACEKPFNDIDIVATLEFMLQLYKRYVAQEQRTETSLVTTVCGHSFHTSCMTEWLAENVTCPLCRNGVLMYNVSLANPDEMCSICLEPLGTNIRHVRNLITNIWSN